MITNRMMNEARSHGVSVILLPETDERCQWGDGAGGRCPNLQMFRVARREREQFPQHTCAAHLGDSVMELAYR